MSRFKVGDCVQVKMDLQEGKWYNHMVSVVGDMLRYRGVPTRIREVFDDDDSDVSYYLEIDNEDWFWTDDMLIGLGGENLDELFDRDMAEEVKPLTIEEVDEQIVELLKTKATLLKDEIKKKQRELDRVERVITRLNDNE